MLTRSKRDITTDVGAFEREEIVFMMRPAIFEIKCPTTERSGLGNDDTTGLIILQLDLGLDRVMTTLHIDEGVLHHSGHAGINGERLASAEQIRTPGDLRVEALGTAVINRKDMVANALLFKDGLELLELVRILVREVVRLAEVLIHMV